MSFPRDRASRRRARVRPSCRKPDRCASSSLPPPFQIVGGFGDLDLGRLDQSAEPARRRAFLVPTLERVCHRIAILLHLPQTLIEFAQPLADDLTHLGARTMSGAAVVDDLSDLVEGETKRLRPFDKFERQERLRIIESISGVGPNRAIEQPAALVEAERL